MYELQDEQTKEHFAVKVERSDVRNPKLELEKRFYRVLQQSQPVGIPSMLQYKHHETYNLLMMDLLGQSLDDLFVKNNKTFSLKTVLLLADSMIQRLEYLHKNNIVHRDLKPANFVLGTGSNSNTIYVIDFGLSKFYIENDKHIPPCTGKNLVGTARYASINVHKGHEYGRRDDMESLGYILVYFLNGGLPW